MKKQQKLNGVLRKIALAQQHAKHGNVKKEPTDVDDTFEAAKPEAAQTETPKPIAAQTGTAIPETAQTDTAKTGPAQTVAATPETALTEPAAPETNENQKARTNKRDGTGAAPAPKKQRVYRIV